MAWIWWARVHPLSYGLPLNVYKTYPWTSFLVFCDSQVINWVPVESRQGWAPPWAPEHTHLLNPWSQYALGKQLSPEVAENIEVGCAQSQNRNQIQKFKRTSTMIDPGRAIDSSCLGVVSCVWGGWAGVNQTSTWSWQLVGQLAKLSAQQMNEWPWQVIGLVYRNRTVLLSLVFLALKTLPFSWSNPRLCCHLNLKG